MNKNNAYVLCLPVMEMPPPLEAFLARHGVSLERPKSHTQTPKAFMMAPEVAKMTFCRLPVLQCPNFIHHVLSLVLWDLFFINKNQ